MVTLCTIPINIGQFNQGTRPLFNQEMLSFIQIIHMPKLFKRYHFFHNPFTKHANQNLTKYESTLGINRLKNKNQFSFTCRKYLKVTGFKYFGAQRQINRFSK